MENADKIQKPIFDITPFTMLDYPDHLACIVWFAGCNMRCRYCYNPHVVFGKGTKDENDLLEFLAKRVGRLEGVILSGGECTLYKGLLELSIKIKKLGFKIKIDTNGSNPQTLNNLLNKKLVDFISLDFKAPKRTFKQITLSNFYDKTIKSLQVLMKYGANFEVRTTVHADLMSTREVEEIADILKIQGYEGTYYIQNYLHTKNSIGNVDIPVKSIEKFLIKNTKIEFRNF